MDLDIYDLLLIFIANIHGFLSLKDKKVITITNGFQKLNRELNRKPNKIWVDKGSEIHNRSMKLFLQNNDTEMHSAQNEGKSVVIAERFIRILKHKIDKYMTSVSKNTYIDKLDDIVTKYNKTYDVKSSTYIDSTKEFNNKDPKFKIGDIARISKYKNIFGKGYTPNRSEEVFVIKEVKNLVQWTYVINDLKGEEIVGTFYEKELQNTNKKEFRIEKGINKKYDKLYVKWKGYNNSFKSWIDKKMHSINDWNFPKPKSFGANAKVELDLSELDLSNYSTKADVKNATDVDTSDFAKKTDLANLKSDVNKLDIDKLKNVPSNLSNLKSKVNKSDVDKLVPVPVDISKLSYIIKK